MEKCSAGNRFRKRILLGFRTVLPAGSLRFGDFGGVIAEEKDCFLELRISEVLAAQARIFGEKILPFWFFGEERLLLLYLPSYYTAPRWNIGRIFQSGIVSFELVKN